MIFKVKFWSIIVTAINRPAPYKAHGLLDYRQAQGGGDIAPPPLSPKNCFNWSG